MKLIYNNLEVVNWVSKNKDLAIGFIPTMGALHKGHLSLISEAKKKADLVVVSIFVNPTQFGDKNDFVNYPSTLDQDLRALENLEVDMVFIPSSAEELYKNENYDTIAFESIENVMEGFHRIGHFEGVARVVKLFLDLIKPNYAFFGEKDFQQLLIIKTLIKKLEIKTEIIACKTVRENDGLAMSSRNARLSKHHRSLAPNIYKVLGMCMQKAKTMDFNDLENTCFKELSKFSSPEYFEIRNANDLSKSGGKNTKWRAFVATKLGDIRLIDNIELN
ncbi:pantoate--beta-alanine ligase [Flavobacteriales bacterium]|nr:pantoate--beta-alanine ligase [Flavobacteriales bacterium]